MKKIPLKFSKSALLLIHLSTAASLLEAQVYPLSENTWENPEFVKRFLGSYGIDSQVEPKISDDELVILQSVAEYASQDKMDDAIDVLKENLDFESSSAALRLHSRKLTFQSEKVSAAIEQYTNAIRKFPAFVELTKTSDWFRCRRVAIQTPRPCWLRQSSSGLRG